MSNLRKINSSGDARATNKNDMERALSSLQISVDFALSNRSAIIKASGNKKDDKKRPLYLGAALDFKGMLERKESFSDKQLSFGLSLYEITMKGLGLPSVGRRHDFTKKW